MRAIDYLQTWDEKDLGFIFSKNERYKTIKNKGLKTVNLVKYLKCPIWNKKTYDRYIVFLFNIVYLIRSLNDFFSHKTLESFYGFYDY